MTSKKKVAFVVGTLAGLAVALVGCAGLTARQQAGPRDDLVGWYRLGNDTLIPVFKSDGTYYSACMGWEVPLRECTEGLESSMIATTIGFDKADNTHFIRIVDPRRGHQPEGTIPPEKRPMTKIAKPSWFRGPRAQRPAQRPRTNDDFLGRYEYVWWPHVRIEIRKEGGRYLLTLGYIDESGVWKILEDPTELTPLPDGLGFTMHRDVSVVYNKSLKRFELIGSPKESSSLYRALLTRVSSSSSRESDAVPLPMQIGIPPVWR